MRRSAARRPWGRRGRTLAGLVVALTATIVVASSASAATYPREDPTDRATYDPYFSQQWALQAMKVPAAWSRSTGSGVRIGIIDTGVDLTHPDVAPKVTASTNCIGAGGSAALCAGSAQDDHGHGTHVAGIAAAVTGNGTGVAGVAPDATLVVVKALGSNGSGALNDVNAGIKWAVDHGARVINLSLEADAGQVVVLPGQSLADGVEYAWQHGAIPVVAAGNSTPSLFGPTGYSGIHAVVVGATGRANEVAWYSSSLGNAAWGLVAPGGDSRGPDGTASCAGALADGCVVSTGWFPGHVNQYADDEGTSMATPQVSGVIALLLAQGLSPQGAVDKLLATAAKLPCGASCHGLVDAAAASGAPVSGPGVPPAPATTLPPVAPSAAPTTVAHAAAGPPYSGLATPVPVSVAPGPGAVAPHVVPPRPPPTSAPVTPPTPSAPPSTRPLSSSPRAPVRLASAGAAGHPARGVAPIPVAAAIVVLLAVCLEGVVLEVRRRSHPSR